jgi:hypothetical protein
MRDALPNLRRIHEQSPAIGGRGSGVTGVAALPEFRADRPSIVAKSRTRVARDRAIDSATIALSSAREISHLGAEGGA